MSVVPAPSRIGALWQQRMQSMREYSIVRDGNAFEAGFSDSVIFSSEYDRARAFLETLMDRYDGVAFGDLFRGREIDNEGGTCFALESREKYSFPSLDSDQLRARLLGDLTLVHGIGPAIRKRLNARGYHSIPDLLEHPHFRQKAKTVLSCISGADSSEIMDLAGSRHSRSHPSVLGAAALHSPEDFVFLDIETLGLFSRPIILFGVGVIECGHLIVHQYLLRDIDEEQAALIATLDHISGERPALATFNGKSFDFPYLVDRLAYYGLEYPGRIPHFDVLHFSRRRWKGRFPSLRLAALEREILNVSRVEDVPGQMVPEFYERYLRSGNPGPLVPIVEHNRQDVISLARLFSYLLEEAYGGC
ncbi:MAG TPA: ribonuclease H-like domain-containing protein [Methanoregula sp.]|nr:ribonuclease H-like domain-containing protein [Methanoregula sp.]